MAPLCKENGQPQRLMEGLSDLHSKPEGAQSHALRSPDNLSGTPCRLPLQGGCKMSREIAPANHKTVAPRSKIRYTIKKENAL